MRVLVTGGGTGGHIYPALAFVNYQKAQDPSAKFMYIGAKRGMEMKILPETDIPFEALEIQGFKRKLSIDNLKTIRLFLKAIRSSKRLIKEFKPDVVIGTGGYVSGAVVYAAARMKIPTIIHEQNSVPGITNKFLSRYVQKIAISFPDSAEYFPEGKTKLVGNPRAQEVAKQGKSDILKKYNLDPEKKTVLIFGGSQGALALNQAVTEALPELGLRDYQVLYASGERYYEEFKTNDDVKLYENLSIQPYISDMAEVMANADLLIGRAGATSIAEFTALGLPAILIPSPYVTNDHQTKNAQSLVNAGAAEMITDQELSGKRLVKTIDQIMNDPKKMAEMSAASKKEGIPDAAARLSKLVQEIS